MNPGSRGPTKDAGPMGLGNERRPDDPSAAHAPRLRPVPGQAGPRPLAGGGERAEPADRAVWRGERGGEDDDPGRDSARALWGPGAVLEAGEPGVRGVPGA